MPAEHCLDVIEVRQLLRHARQAVLGGGLDVTCVASGADLLRLGELLHQRGLPGSGCARSGGRGFGRGRGLGALAEHLHLVQGA
jgi:hypothetical protein